MILSLVVAASDNNVIGRAGSLPWSLPDDLKHFRALTIGKTVIMGRKTYESIRRPLPERRNIVITRQKEFVAPGCEVVRSLQEAIEQCNIDQSGSTEPRSETKTDEVCVIGGGEIYREAIEKADRIYLTRVHTSIEGDTTFPMIDSTKWQEVKREEHSVDERHQHSFTFIDYERVR